MIGALILVLSIGTLLAFFVSYCRAQLAAFRNIGLSDQVREATGVLGGPADAGEFAALVGLSRLCPGPQNRGRGVTAVCIYYRLLCFANAASSPFMPAVLAWVERERFGCAHFAAVILDRQISYSREMIAEQFANSL
jgi:hypothetical protein